MSAPDGDLLRLLPMPALRGLVGDLGLLGVDRRSRAAMQASLARLPREEILDALGTADLRALAKACELPAGGRREQVLERLLEAPRARSALPETFVALDFETADDGRDSACALALVRVEGGRIARREARLIRPPRRQFRFTYIHGITWPMVASEPCFGELWPSLAPLLDGAGQLFAHNASFDRSVLRACCASAGIEPPALPFACTVKLARERWGIYPTKLPDVCQALGIPLRHHDAASDAEACARIVLAARQ